MIRWHALLCGLVALWLLLPFNAVSRDALQNSLLCLVGPEGTVCGGKEAPADSNVREVWTGSLYSSTFRVGVCVKPDGTLSGVLLLHLANGDVDVYHVRGAREGDKVTAQHHSGHSFVGTMASSSEMQGIISLKNGLNISLKGQRWRHASLPEEDACF